MSNLIFLYNELMNPDVFSSMQIPLEFIAFGITDAKMYSQAFGGGNFIVPLDTNKKWGNDKVYGALYILKDVRFYLGILDAYHACSYDKLRRNHFMDIHHRHEIDVTPIFFNSLDDLSRLKYREGTTIPAVAYMGNIKHPKINLRVSSSQSRRIIDGIDPLNYKKQYMEVLNWKE